MSQPRVGHEVFTSDGVRVGTVARVEAHGMRVIDWPIGTEWLRRLPRWRYVSVEQIHTVASERIILVDDGARRGAGLT